MWPFRFVTVSVCGRSGLWPFGLWPFRFVAVSVCGRFGLRPFRFVAVSVCGRIGCDRFGLRPLWPVQFVAFSVCGSFGLWPFRFVVVPVCGLFGLWPFRSVAVSVCGRFGLWPFLFWPLRFVAVMTRNLCLTYDSIICSSNKISDRVKNCALHIAYICRGIWLLSVQRGPDLNAIYYLYRSQIVLECGTMEQTKSAIMFGDETYCIIAATMWTHQQQTNICRLRPPKN